MRGPKPTPIDLSHRQRLLLQKIVRRATSPQYQVKRAKMILCMDEGKNNSQTAEKLGGHRETVQQWRNRWLKEVPRLTAIEVSGGSDQELKKAVEEVLRDQQRQGAPVKFTATQVTQLIAMAYELPQNSAHPVSHWTARELAEEAVNRGIVDMISVGSVSAIFKKKPSLSPTPVATGSTLVWKSRKNLSSK